MRKDHTHTPEYHPSNVTIVRNEDGVYKVLDFDGAFYANARTYNDALALQRKRRGVIKAALTRRANKARAERAALETTDQRIAEASRAHREASRIRTPINLTSPTEWVEEHINESVVEGETINTGMPALFTPDRHGRNVRVLSERTWLGNANGINHNGATIIGPVFITVRVTETDGCHPSFFVYLNGSHHSGGVAAHLNADGKPSGYTALTWFNEVNVPVPTEVRHLTYNGATSLCRTRLSDAPHDAPTCDVCAATADHPRYTNTTHSSRTMKALCVTCHDEEPVTITVTRATAGKLVPWVQYEKAPEARALHAAITKALGNA